MPVRWAWVKVLHITFPGSLFCENSSSCNVHLHQRVGSPETGSPQPQQASPASPAPVTPLKLPAPTEIRQIPSKKFGCVSSKRQTTFPILQISHWPRLTFARRKSRMVKNARVKSGTSLL